MGNPYRKNNCILTFNFCNLLFLQEGGVQPQVLQWTEQTINSDAACASDYSGSGISYDPTAMFCASAPVCFLFPIIEIDFHNFIKKS